MIDTSIKTAFNLVLVKTLENAVNTRPLSTSRVLADQLYVWLQTETRKRVTHKTGAVSWITDATQMPKVELDQTDLPVNLAVAKEWIYPMAEAIRLTVLNNGRFEVRAGAYDSYLNQLAFGSTWFEGHPDLAMFIILELAGGI